MSSCCRSSIEVRRGAGVGGDDVEPDHRAEQHQPAGQLEHQELQRGGRALLAAEATDEEVRRDQRRLEDDVEEEHVGREEDHQRQGLERQRPGEPRLALVVGAVVPGREQHDRDQHDGEQHQQQPEPVEPDRVVDAERLDPGVGLGELEAGAVAVELGRGDDADHESHQRGDQRGLLRQRALGAERRRERTDERDHPEDGEPGEVVHARFTASSASTTRSTPAEQREGVGADEPVLGAPHQGSDAADRDRPAGERAVHHGVVEDQQPRRERLARLDHELVVDRVAVDVGTGGAGHERDVLGRLAGYVAPARRRRPRRPRRGPPPALPGR